MGKVDEIADLREQVEDLQSRLAFQEDTINALDSVVARQQRQIESLQALCEGQKMRLEELSTELEKGLVDQPPPHY